MLGFLDDSLPDSARLEALNLRYLGDRTADLPSGTTFVVAVGAGAPRQAISRELENRGLTPGTLIHPSAWIGAPVELGPGSVVCAGNILTTNISFGPGAQINLSCTIGHDVVVGEYVTLSPAVSLSGAVTIGDLATVYTRAALNPRIPIGA